MSRPAGKIAELRWSRRALGIGAGAALAAGHSRRSAAQDGGWRQISSEGPSPRWDHTLSAHDKGKSLVLFGGRDGAGTALGDTWSFSRTRESWTHHDAPGPSPRFGHAVATDSVNERLYLFGGQAGSDFFNDLWHLDLASGVWTQSSDGGALSPRYGTSMALTNDGLLIVSHGFTFEGRFDDTWGFDLGAGEWVEFSPDLDHARPLKRCLHEAVWAGHQARMLLFGGCSSGFGPCPQGDLWSFEPATRLWTDITVADAPSARSNPALVYDEGRELIYLAGGLAEGGYAGDFWSLTMADDAPLWTLRNVTGPSPRASHDAVMTGPWLYLFGGFGDGGALGDLWQLDVRSLDPG